MKAKVRTLKQKVVISASPKEVYAAYIDPKKLSKITGSKATGKAVVGGNYTTYGDSIVGKYLELEDGKRVVQEWTNNDYRFGPVRLELSFNKATEGTEVYMVLSDVPEEQADEVLEGWIEYIWDPMKKYFCDLSKA